jgi:hypothetical protein
MNREIWNVELTQNKKRDKQKEEILSDRQVIKSVSPPWTGIRMIIPVN